jgi:micrococcal nuclease
LIVGIAALILLVRLVEEIGEEQQPGERFIISRVVDGDTMELKGGDRLRLLALDTPEEGEPYYNEATSLARRLTLGQQARIEFAKRRRDKYGRLLGYLYIDSLFINRIIIDSGFGYVYLFSDNELASEPVRLMLQAQKSAISRKVGLWSLPREAETAYINNPGSFRLHRPSCRSLGDLKPGRFQQFASREDGLMTGLSPCRNCKP